MQSILTRLQESPSIAKFEIVEDELGKRTTISMNPRYVFFENQEKVVIDEDGEKKLALLDRSEWTYNVFDLRDKSLNQKIPVEQSVVVNGKKYQKRSRSFTLHSASHIVPTQNGYFCPVLYNSKHHMIELVLNKYSKMLSYNFIDYISIMQFKDGTSYINVNHTEISYNQKMGKLFFSKNNRYSLKLRGDNGRTSLLKNGRLCMSYKQIVEFFGIISRSSIFNANGKSHKEYKVFQELFCELFFEDYNGCYDQFLNKPKHNIILLDSHSMVSLYRVKRNRQLKDLPWNELELTQLYENPKTHNICNYTVLSDSEKRLISNTRANINRYLRKGDSKKATDACFYGFTYPKAFRKIMLKTNPMQFDRKTYEYLHRIIELKGVNKAIEYFSDDGEPNVFILEQTHALEAICLNFKSDKMIRHLKDRTTSHDSSNQIKDALSMTKELIDMDIEVNINERDIFKYHDLVSKFYNVIMKAKTSIELDLYKSVDTSEQLPTLHEGEYTIRSPRNAYELLEVGNIMNHCVGSYMKNYFYRNLEICLVEKNGDYHVCLEIIKDTIVQAKLSNNRPLTEDKTVLQLVFKWAKQNNIKISSSDCGVIAHHNLSYDPDCEERLALLKDIKLKADELGNEDYLEHAEYQQCDDLIPF